MIFFILTLSPWVIRNYAVQGEFLVTDTHGGWVLWQKLLPFHNFGNYLENAYKKAHEIGFENISSTQMFRWVFKDNLFGGDATYSLIKRDYPDQFWHHSRTLLKVRPRTNVGRVYRRFPTNSFWQVLGVSSLRKPFRFTGIPIRTELANEFRCEIQCY